MDGTREVSFVLDAQNEIDGFISKNRPSLGIRCAKHKPEVYIYVGEPFETEYGELNATSVRVKFDDNTPVKQRWSESTNLEAAFAANPAKLTRQLTTSKKFLFEFTPFQKRETTVIFNVGDLKSKLESMADVCGLDEQPQKKSHDSKSSINDANQLIVEEARKAAEEARKAARQAKEETMR
jgi:hypothetical protein